MKYISVSDLEPSNFVSNQVKNTYTRDQDLEKKDNSTDSLSTSSISSRINQSTSFNALSSIDEFDLNLDEPMDSKMDAEENVGICAIIEVCGYTQMLESLADNLNLNFYTQIG